MPMAQVLAAYRARAWKASVSRADGAQRVTAPRGIIVAMLITRRAGAAKVPGHRHRHAVSSAGDNGALRL